MSKAEKFIQDYTRNCSNEIIGGGWNNGEFVQIFNPWLTPDQAMKAVEIVREETLQEVKEKLSIMLNTSVDNKHFFEQLDDYIDELEKSNKDE